MRLPIRGLDGGRTDRDVSEALISVYGTDFGIHSPTWISRFTDMTRPLVGRRVPDLDLVTADGPLRVFQLLHEARPVLLNINEPGGFDISPWADRLRSVDAKYTGSWELPVIGTVTAPTTVLIRPDGYVAWVADRSQLGLADAVSTWFGPPASA